MAERQRSRISLASYLVLFEKRFDQTRDFLAVGFQCEVSSVEKVCLEVLEIATVRSSSFRREDEIVLRSVGRDCWWAPALLFHPNSSMQ